MMRLDKFIADCGKGSRKEIKLQLRRGAATVNGEAVKNGDRKVDENSDEIYYMGEKLNYRRFVYLMLNKPAGVVSATYDNRDSTVVSLIGEEYSNYKLFPVGRLDKDTEGLLIITNDGETAHRLLAPKSHVNKTYYAETNEEIPTAAVKKFNDGITLDDGYVTLPATLKIISAKSAYVTICEGKFHQVKRMFADVGCKVAYLKRITFGEISLDNTLKPGEYRELGEEEIKILVK